MDLNLRLNILKESGQLLEENYNKVIKSIKFFEEKEKIKLLEENAAMFITHLCSALARIDKNELVNKMDKMLKDNLKEEEKYEKAFNLTKELEEISGVFPEEEFDYIVLHVCTLLQLKVIKVD